MHASSFVDEGPLTDLRGDAMDLHYVAHTEWRGTSRPGAARVFVGYLGRMLGALPIAWGDVTRSMMDIDCVGADRRMAHPTQALVRGSYD